MPHTRLCHLERCVAHVKGNICACKFFHSCNPGRKQEKPSKDEKTLANAMHALGFCKFNILQLLPKFWGLRLYAKTKKSACMNAPLLSWGQWGTDKLSSFFHFASTVSHRLERKHTSISLFGCIACVEGGMKKKHATTLQANKQFQGRNTAWKLWVNVVTWVRAGWFSCSLGPLE